MTPRVLVVGAVNVDLVVHTDRLPGPGGDRGSRQFLERFASAPLSRAT